MTFEDDFEGLVALRDILREWDDRYACVVRVELRPRNKHSDEDLLDEADRPRLFLETIRFEVEQAVECAQLAHTLRTLAGDRAFSIHVSERPDPIYLESPARPVRLADHEPTRPVKLARRSPPLWFVLFLMACVWVIVWAVSRDGV